MSNSDRAFSLAFLTISDVGPVEAVTTAAQAGYQMVGLRLLPATADEAPYPLLTDDRLLGEVSRALADTGIRVADVELIRLRPDLRASAYVGFFARAQALGASFVTVVSDDPSPTRATDNFAQLCQLAAPCGLTLNIEPMPWTHIRDLNQAITLINSCGQHNAGILIDALHFFRRGTPFHELDAVPREMLKLFQICDAPLAFDPQPDAIRHLARTARLLPGEGELDLKALLERIPPQAIISVEVPSLDLMTQCSPLARSRRALLAALGVCAAAITGVS